PPRQSARFPYTTLFRSPGVGGRGAGRERPQRLLLGLRGRRLGQEQARTHPHGSAGRAPIGRIVMISRSRAASLGRETVAILEARSEEHTSELQSLRHLV